jgi:hypothetical protein
VDAKGGKNDGVNVADERAEHEPGLRACGGF